MQMIKTKRVIFIGLFVMLVGAGSLPSCNANDAYSKPRSAEFVNAVGDPQGFQRADPNRQLVFPADHGPHPEYQTEWWYYTGNLTTAAGRHFGYQLTFFRRALLPAGEAQPRSSGWSSNQVYMGHFALSDTETRQHYAFERFSRGAAGLAGAQSAPYHVWLENWQVQESTTGLIQLSAHDEGITIDLQLQELKGPVLHGISGYSRKGPDPGNASHYYSQSRLHTTGTVTIDGETFPISGNSWMDHEFSTSALSADQVGWDWFALQMDDDVELMLYQIRRADSSSDPYSIGSLIKPDGELISINNTQFEITVEDTWRSPGSGTEYPSQWRIRVPTQEIDLSISPSFSDQEMDLSYNYWEGAVNVAGAIQGSSVRGIGYVELTGYARSLEGEF